MFNINELNWEKMNGLLPAIVQDVNTNSVLMLGYMNQEALQKTIESKQVTFFSRSKNCLWTKGETSGNTLELINIFADCDKDTLLVHAIPKGPICHLGSANCFNQENKQTGLSFIEHLEKIIQERDNSRPKNSYTAKLLNSGISRIAQKVGEESIEVVLAAVEKNDEEFCSEAADLLFHLLVLLRAKNLQISDVFKILKERQ